MTQEDRFGIRAEVIRQLLEEHRELIRMGCCVPTRKEVATSDAAWLEAILVDWFWESPEAIIPTYRQVQDDGTVREYGCDRPAPDLPASTPLSLIIDTDADGPVRSRWEDDKKCALESKLAEIAASIIAAGEANFRRGLRQAEEWAEQTRRQEEQRRREKIEKRNAERMQHLRESGELLRQAQDVRALVARVRDAALAGSVGVDQARLEEWERWASAEADPVLSGQVMTHLVPESQDR